MIITDFSQSSQSNPDGWTIQLGITRRHAHSYFGQKMKVKRVVPHPMYNMGVAHDNDVALFQVMSKYTKNIAKQILPYDKNWERNLCPRWDLNLRSPFLCTGALPLSHLKHTYQLRSNFSPIHISIQDSQNVIQILTILNESNPTSGYFDWIYLTLGRRGPQVQKQYLWDICN